MSEQISRWSGDWEGAERLLCVRLDSIGDVLMTTPAIRALKESRPGRQLTLLTSPAGATAAALVPEVDEVVVYSAPWLKATAPRGSSAAEHAMAQRLRASGFDGCVIFTVYTQNPLPSAFLCYLADIPLRLAHCRENPYQLLTHWLPDPEPEQGVRHEVRRQLDLVATVGCRSEDERLSLQVPIFARANIRSMLERAGLDFSRPWLVVHPGASAPSRRYPPEGFARVVARLVREDGYQAVLSASERERDLVEQIHADAGVHCISLAGCLDLAELAALIELAPLLLSNNSGPAHVAAAVGTPVVDLYALTNPQHTPWGVPCRVLSHDVPCRFCYKSICPEGHNNCLRGLSTEEIIAAINELRAEMEASRRPEELLTCD